MSELAKLEEDIQEVQNEPEFTVTDDQKAEWCLRKIREAKADKEFWKQFYDAQYAAVEESANSTISQMETMLRKYFETVPHKVTDTQENYKLPSGKLVLKKQEPEYERNEDEIIKWLKENDGTEFIKVKESLDWAGLKKNTAVVGEQIANEDGEFIPGVKVIERPDIFKVEVK